MAGVNVDTASLWIALSGAAHCPFSSATKNTRSMKQQRKGHRHTHRASKMANFRKTRRQVVNHMMMPPLAKHSSAIGAKTTIE